MVLPQSSPNTEEVNAKSGDIRSKKNSQFANMYANQVESKVLVIYTGGTIGMVRNKNSALEPLPNQLVKRIRLYPQIHDAEYADLKYGKGSSMAPLILPYVHGEKRRICYTITEYDPLLDSSNMTFKDWERIAEDIQQSYKFFDGFVILHGTDTLSYTASALSFMLENLGKTVIITGSQIPIFETRTDGKDNFTSSLILAGNYAIPEVCVFFNSKLFRGNRTIKSSTDSLDAFVSPNVPPIVKMGIEVDIDYRLIFRPCTVDHFKVHTKLDPNVGLLRIFPNIPTATIHAFLQPPMKGVVLQTFGAGNIPSNRPDLMAAFKEANERGIIIVNCTQCISGSVSEIYETGRQLLDYGVVPGYDMTPEAALAKLSYVLSKTEWNLEMKIAMMQNNLRGELTNGKAPEIQEFDLVDAVARSLHLSTLKELQQLGDVLFPAMVNSAVISGDINKMDNLKNYGADLSASNYDLRTALHIACSEGNLDVVKHLLINGAAVHFRDRYDRSPLIEAVSIDHHEIIKLMVKCGAHIAKSSTYVGENLCHAAEEGLVKRLESWRLAGADLSSQDGSGRTALHLAVLHNHENIIEYLLKHDVDLDAKDNLGMSAYDYALKVNHASCANLIKDKIFALSSED